MNNNQQFPIPPSGVYQRLDVEFALQAAGLGVWELDPTTNIVNWDDTCRALFGLARDNYLPYEQAIQYIHPDDVDRVDQAVRQAMTAQSDGHYDVTYRTVGGDDNQLRWVRFSGRAYFTPQGQMVRFAGTAQNVTEQIIAKQSLEASAVELDRLRVALKSAQIGSWTLDIARQQVWWDAQCKELYGFRQDDIVPYNQVLSYMHDADRQRVDEAISWALSAQSGGHYDIQFRTVGADDGQLRWLHCRGRAEFDATGIAYRFAGTAQDITTQVLTRQQLEASEAKLRGIIEAAPAGIGLFMGRELVIEMPNQTFIDIVGRGPGVEGLPLREAMPELLTEGQPFLAILDTVFTSGVPFFSPASLVKIIQNGVLTANYYNIAYVPIRNAEGNVYAILDIAIDVTEQVKMQQSLKENQAILEAMIDVAELGTYSVDIAANQLIKSPRVAGWYGLPEVTDVATSISRIRSIDQERVSQVFAKALEPNSSGTYQVEYVVVNPHTNQQHKLQTVGQVRWGLDNQPTHVDGLVRDITLQHELQIALQQQVQQRTHELAATNEELATSNEELATANFSLASSNEEYAVINEELEEANSLLTRANDNLQTFAYVASHDLQEPLRKIQQFGDLLKTRFANSVQGEELAYIERMQLAASRMSRLIKDLLSFSRISTQRNIDKPVDLNQLLTDVLSVLDLRMAETGTQLQVDPLPVVLGDPAQLGQLFQNLISNAIKFQRADVTPRIQISNQLVTVSQLPVNIKPARRSAVYCRLDVVDNGIGFDEKYLDRIFQVFQRLHGKNEFAGTGVGLAICEKVVSNHGGVITASSQPGQGATFSVYLPA